MARNVRKGRAARRSGKPGAKGGLDGSSITFDHAFIPTRNFEEAWHFWTQTLGLKGGARWGNPEYAGTVKLGDGSLVVAAGEEGFYEELGYTREAGKPQLYLRTPNVEKLHKAMAARGAKVVRGPLTTHFAARCFSVEGPDGMVVVFVESK